jgi:hypothetical protein
MTYGADLNARYAPCMIWNELSKPLRNSPRAGVARNVGSGHGYPDLLFDT